MKFDTSHNQLINPVMRNRPEHSFGMIVTQIWGRLLLVTLNETFDSSTLTNFRTVRPVLGDLPWKLLHIPRPLMTAITMNRADRANQLRRNLTVHQPFEHRTWRLIRSHLFDYLYCQPWIDLGETSSRNKTGKRGNVVSESH